jgi:hypothetical protein
VEPTRPAISSSGSTGGILADALAKVRTAPKFRVEFSFLFGVTESSKYQEQTFIDLTGQADNGKAQVTLKGVLMAMLSGDLKTPVEIITADGKSYLRGVSMFGMTDPKVWYVTDDSSAGGFGDFAKPEGFEDWLGDTDPADFKKVRTESLDNQSCDVYVNNVKSMDAVPFLKIAADFQDQADMSVLDKGEMSLWLCRDGFLDFQGHNQSSVAEKGAIKMLWHAWDYGNSAISITLPKDAKPMPGQ